MGRSEFLLEQVNWINATFLITPFVRGSLFRGGFWAVAAIPSRTGAAVPLLKSLLESAIALSALAADAGVNEQHQGNLGAT
jgi:hypothetical protein